MEHREACIRVWEWFQNNLGAGVVVDTNFDTLAGD
jgi:hypothetical protein